MPDTWEEYKDNDTGKSMWSNDGGKSFSYFNPEGLKQVKTSDSLYSPTFGPLVSDSTLGLKNSDPLVKKVTGGMVQGTVNLIPSIANQAVNATMGLPGIIHLLSRAMEDPVGTRDAATQKVKDVVNKINTPTNYGNIGGPEGILGDLATGVGHAINKYNPMSTDINKAYTPDWGFNSNLSKTLRFDPAALPADALSLYAMKEGGPANVVGDTKGLFGDIHQIINDWHAKGMIGQAKDKLNLRLGLPDSTVSDVVSQAAKTGDSLPLPILAGDKKAIEQLVGTDAGRKKLEDLTAIHFGQAENLVQQKGLAPESQLSLTEGPQVASDKLRKRFELASDQVPEANGKFKTNKEYSTLKTVNKFAGDLDNESTTDLTSNWTKDPKTFAKLDDLPGMQPEVKESILHYKALKEGLQPDGTFNGDSVVRAVDRDRDLYNDPALKSLPGYSERMASFQTFIHTLKKMDAVPPELRTMNALQMDSARNRFNILVGATMSGLTGSKFGELRAATGLGNEMLSFSRSDFARLTTNPEANWVLNTIAGKTQGNSALKPAVRKLARIAGTMGIPATWKVGDQKEQPLVNLQEVGKD